MKDVFARQELERYLERASLLARPGALIGCAREAILTLLCGQEAALYLYRPDGLHRAVPLENGGCRLESAPGEQAPVRGPDAPLCQIAEPADGPRRLYLALGRQGQAPGFWRVTGYAVPLDEDSIAAAAMVSEDVYRRLHDTLARAGAQEGLREENRSERADLLPADALAALSHELRGPLSGALSAVEVLREMLKKQEGPLSKEKCGQLLGAMEQDLYKALRTSSNILEAGRAEARAHREDAQYFSAQEFLCRLAEDVKPYAQANGIKLHVRGARGQGFMMRTDAAALERILLNLLGNAMKYCPKGEGQVTLAMKRVQCGGKELAQFSVSDNGPGIAPQDLPHVFEKYWRAPAARRQGKEGAGLGLYLASSLAGQLGGTLSAGGVPGGKGAEFILRVPLLFYGEGGEEGALQRELELHSQQTTRYDAGERQGRVRCEMAQLAQWPEPSDEKEGLSATVGK